MSGSRQTIEKKVTQNPFWAFEIEKTTALLASDRVRGIAISEVEKRLRIFGFNTLASKKRFSRLGIFLNQFKSPLIYILIACAATTFFLREIPDTIIILLAIFANALLGYYQENKAENALEELNSYIEERARVIRDGKEEEIDAKNLVPGDVVHLSYGARVPADARIISAVNLSIDEAILTGESLPVSKEIQILSEGASIVERKNMVFAGTLVVEGYATVMVTGTGPSTEIGKIATLLGTTKKEKTPLQAAVWKLAWIITVGVSILVFGIFALGISRGEELFEMFLVSAAVAVGAIPEALPIGLTAVLAVGVERIAKRKGIMRSLAAAETLGSTTLIITDKTGTLTEAKMQLVDMFSAKEILAGDVHEKQEELTAPQKELLTFALCNTDVLIENPKEAPAEWRIEGRALEVNLVRAAGKGGLSTEIILKSASSQILLPFSSSYKFSAARVYMAAPHLLEESHEKEYAVLLGAPDVLLKKSKIKKEEYLTLLAHVEKASNEGKRVVGVALMPIKKGSTDTSFNTADAFSGALFLGTLLFYDPVRKSVPEALAKMNAYGARIVIATGDLKGTALAVARSIGWNVDEGEVLTGDELEKLSDSELLTYLSHIKVFARVTPEDKLRIGKLFQQMGEVVGMTGDGVNDSPALKAMDIGIALGGGSDVAKSVADLVLLDNDFNTIVSAIEEGRRMLHNIRKTFIYLMSNCLDEVILIGGSLLLGLSLPLSALQIIWVNFFTGSLPAIAFAFDDDGDLQVHEKTRQNGRQSIINDQVKFLTLGIGILTSVLLFALYVLLVKLKVPTDISKTFLFACFASYILFVAFSFRSLRKPLFSYSFFGNRMLTFGVLLGIASLFATLYVPSLQKLFNTVYLPPVWILLLFVWILVNITLVEGAKWLFYRKQ